MSVTQALTRGYVRYAGPDSRKQTPELNAQLVMKAPPPMWLPKHFQGERGGSYYTRDLSGTMQSAPTSAALGHVSTLGHIAAGQPIPIYGSRSSDRLPGT